MGDYWVDRDGVVVTGTYANSQFEGQEQLPDTDVAVLGFLNKPKPEPAKPLDLSKLTDAQKEKLKTGSDKEKLEMIITILGIK